MQLHVEVEALEEEDKDQKETNFVSSYKKDFQMIEEILFVTTSLQPCQK